MSNILKLVQLDKALIKPYYKYFLVLIIPPVVSTFSYGDITSGIIFAMIIMSMTSTYTFSVAEKNDLNRLYGLLPVSKKDIVTGRYIFTALLGLVLLVISLALNLIVLGITNTAFKIDEVIIGISFGVTIYAFFTAIQLPGFFRFGAIKGRAFSFIPIFGSFLIGGIATILRPNSASSANLLVLIDNPLGMLLIAILLSVVLYGISIGITKRIYDRMEL